VKKMISSAQEQMLRQLIVLPLSLILRTAPICICHGFKRDLSFQTGRGSQLGDRGEENSSGMRRDE
jgi:hypothetical protein